MIKLNKIYETRQYRSLDDVFADDETDLLDDIKPLTQSTKANSVIAQQFDEINAFIAKHGNPPSSTSTNLQEKILARSLTAIINNTEHHRELQSLDKYNLLPPLDKPTPPATNPEAQAPKAQAPKKTTTSINSLDDIFADEDFGLLDGIQPEILLTDDDKQTHTPYYDQYDDEEVAKRFECPDFEQFTPVFERIHHAIQAGNFSKTSFSSVKNIRIGSVFVLQGLLCYVADIYPAEARKNERNQYRLRLIFANGTESNMLIRSLATAQYKYDNSYQLIITDPDWKNDDFISNFSKENDRRRMTGVIYVATLAKTPIELQHYQYLHKIGYSTLTADIRTKYAINNNAFLRQSVNIQAEWQIYDANARSVEQILHAFFANQRVAMSIQTEEKSNKVNEWFNIPLSEIEKAIELVITGEINQYYVDDITLTIRPKQPQITNKSV